MQATYHLKVIDLLPNLLGKQRSETVASRNLSTPIVLTTRPCFMELNARTEDDISTTNS